MTKLRFKNFIFEKPVNLAKYVLIRVLVSVLSMYSVMAVLKFICKFKGRGSGTLENLESDSFELAILILICAPLIETAILILLSISFLFFKKNKLYCCIFISLAFALLHGITNPLQGVAITIAFTIQGGVFLSTYKKGIFYAGSLCFLIHSLSNIPFVLIQVVDF